MIRTGSGWTVAVVVAMLVAGAAAFQVSRSSQSAYLRAIDRRVDEIVLSSRPTRGRLFGQPYSEYESRRGLALTFGLSSWLTRLEAGSEDHLRRQTAVDTISGKWTDAALGLRELHSRFPRDAGIVNDLGVISLELAAGDRWHLAEASEFFRTAIDLAPSAPEPLYNLALAYEQQGLAGQARKTRDTLRQLEPRSPWLEELDARSKESESIDAPLGESSDLWQTLKAYLGGTEPEPVPAFRERAALILTDPTVEAILAPLEGPHRSEVLAARQAVSRGLAALRGREFGLAFEELERARSQLADVNSELDALWLARSRLDVRLWSEDPNRRGLREDLASIVREAERLGFRWLEATALTFQGSVPFLAGSRPSAVRSLERARSTFEDIGAWTDAIRPWLYQTTYLLQEGSTREGFGQAVSMIERTKALLGPEESAQFRHSVFLTVGMANVPARVAIAYLEEAAELGSPDQVAEDHARLATLYAPTDPVVARRHLEQAGGGEENGPSRGIQLHTTLAKADLLSRSGEFEEAEQLLNDGLLVMAGLGKEFETAIRQYVYAYSLAMAHVYEATGRIEAARAHYVAAVEAVENADNELEGRSSLSFDDERRAVYESIIAFEIDQNDIRRAWSYHQKYRSKLLAEFVGGLGIETTSDTNWEPLADEAGNGVMLEYTILEDRLIIWLHAGGDPSAVSIPAEREYLTSDIRRFLELLELRSRSPEFAALSASLYEKLIRPVEEDLAGAEWIAIVPDRVLHRIPFAALVDARGVYLARRFDLMQATTGAGFHAQPGANAETFSLVAMSPPDADEAMRRELESIDGAYPEIETISGYAVTNALFTERINGAGLFIYNGHSEEGTGSLSAAIVLNAADPEQTVTAPEIAEQRMAPNAVVVLSSCDSSIGNFVGGVEFKGLTSAFLAAGAGVVVGSLWPVASAETTDLMIEFHRHVAGGTPVATALGEAQRSMIDADLHPFYWAGFTVTGNRTALEPAPFAAVTAEARLSR